MHLPAQKKNNILAFLSLPVLLLACTFLILTTIGGLIPGLTIYDEKRTLETILLFFACTALTLKLCRPPSHQPTLSRPAIYLLSTILILGIASSLQGKHLALSLLDIATYLSLFFLVTHIALEYKKKHTLHLLILGTIAICICIQLVSFISAIAAQIVFLGKMDLSDQNLLLNYTNIRFLNQFQSWTLALCILPLLLFRPLSLPTKITLFTLAVGWWFLLFFTQGRGTLVGILTATIFILLVFKQKSFIWIKLQIAAASIAAAIYFIITYLTNWSSGQDSFIEKHVIGLSKRDILWQRAIDLFQQNPSLGIGPANYSCELDIEFAHPHSSLLQTLSEWGSIATTLVALLFVFGLIKWIKHCKSTQSDDDQTQVNIALSASLATAGTHSLVSGIIVMPTSQVAMALIIGWMIGIYRAANPLPPINSTSIIGTISLCSLTAITLIITTYQTFPREENFSNSTPNSYLWHHPAPRHWLYGKHCAAEKHQKILDGQNISTSIKNGTPRIDSPNQLNDNIPSK